MIISWVDCQETPAKQRQFERQALAAREWFKQHGPPDAPVFPIGYAERERLKIGGLPLMVAWYARSLAGQGYNFAEHPSFDDYAAGVMASEEHAPDFIRNNEEMRRRFPPRPLSWLGSGLYWCPPRPERKKSRRAPAEQRLLQILKDLPPDRAWWVSHSVVRYQDVQFQRSQLPPSECRLDQSIDSIPIPDSILRAMARQAHHAGRET